MTRCTSPGCLRKPAYPDQARCEQHRERWLPEWRRRAEARPDGLRKDLTGIGSPL